MSDRLPDPPRSPRMAAVAAMTAVTEDGRLLPEVLPGLVNGLSPPERARAGRLATEALRWAPRSDRLLSPFLRRKPYDRVMNAMRLALMEINVDGTPDHAAVDAAVGLVERKHAGLVNAVLRNVGRTGTEWDSLPVPEMPKWLRKWLVAAWGKEAVAAMEVVHAAGAPLDLTPKDGNAEGLAVAVGGEVLPTGSVRVRESGQVSAMAGYDDGTWWVQDAAAALPAKLLAAKPGERVLDLCAAPGGKTMQLAAAGAEVTAVDISEARAARITENLERTGLSAEVVIADALEYDAAPFDAILLDAPCSATGTLRRHPDLAFAKKNLDLGPLTDLQKALIDRAVALLKPGGRLVVCTCSLLPEEGEALREAAWARHPELSPLPADLPEIAQFGVAPGSWRTRPDQWADAGGLDGFHMAAFCRGQSDLGG